MNHDARVPLAISWVIVVGLLTLPLLLVETPVLTDFANHLARSYITRHIAEDADLRAIYSIDWRPLPNLGSDLVILALGHVMSVEAAGRVLLLLCVLLPVSGVAVLNRVLFERWSWWPLLAALPAYNGAFMAGFVGFSLAAGLTPFAVALWIATRDWAMPLRLGLNSTAALALYFCHGFAFGLFGLVIGGYELARWWSARRRQEKAGATSQAIDGLVSLIVPALVPVLLYLSFGLAGAAESEFFLEGWRPLSKVRGLLMPVLTYDLFLDGLTMIFLIATPLILLWCRWLEVAVVLVPSIVILLLCFLAMPVHFLGTSFMGSRVTILAVFLALAATRPHGAKRVIDHVIAGAALLLLVARTTIVAINWSAAADWSDRFQALSKEVEPRSSVAFVFPSLRVIQENRFRGYPDWHYSLINFLNLNGFGVYPLTLRGAFTPTIFAYRGQQILSVNPPWRSLSKRLPGGDYYAIDGVFRCSPEGELRVDPQMRAFDYLVVLYFDHLTPQQQSRLNTLPWVWRDYDLLLLEVDDLPVAEGELPKGLCP